MDFGPSEQRKLHCIIRLVHCRSRNAPTNSADEAAFIYQPLQDDRRAAPMPESLLTFILQHRLRGKESCFCF
jgi:hypothetical protein